MAQLALYEISADLRSRGETPWWIVPQVYWRELSGALLVIALWLLLARRYPPKRSAGALKLGALVTCTALPPIVFTGWLLHAGLSTWAKGFLPATAPFAQVPLSVSIFATSSACLLLLAAEACWQKPIAAQQAGTSSAE